MIQFERARQPLTAVEQAFARAFLDQPCQDHADLVAIVQRETGAGNRFVTGMVREALTALRQKSGALLKLSSNQGLWATPEDQAALRLALKASVAKTPPHTLSDRR